MDAIRTAAAGLRLAEEREISAVEPLIRLQRVSRMTRATGVASRGSQTRYRAHCAQHPVIHTPAGEHQNSPPPFIRLHYSLQIH